MYRSSGQRVVRSLLLRLGAMLGLLLSTLSLTQAQTSPPIPPFGVEPYAPQAAGVGAKWVRIDNLIRWDRMQTSYNGPIVWPNSSDIVAAADPSKGMTPLVVIRGAPSWALQNPSGPLCGPIHPYHYTAFADFVRQVVNTYKVAPYNVKYWEIGNEPDDGSGSYPDSFGCWGNGGTDGGGTAYAAMLRVVYSAIKAAAPSASVVLGGLMGGCTPEGGDCTGGEADYPDKFIRAVIANAPDSFDVLAYHAYAYYVPGNDSRRADWDRTIGGKWEARGGRLLGKLDYYRDLLEWRAPNKRYMMNEGGLLLHCTNDRHECPEVYAANRVTYENYKANYAVRMLVRGWANGLINTSWYTIASSGWHHSELYNQYMRVSTRQPASGSTVWSSAPSMAAGGRSCWPASCSTSVTPGTAPGWTGRPSGTRTPTPPGGAPTATARRSIRSKPAGPPRVTVVTRGGPDGCA